MIYVIHEAQSGMYKVGKARNRMMAIRQRMPAIARARRQRLNRRCTLTLTRWIPWPADMEMAIHRYCWRLWRGDEWFIDGEELQQVLTWALDACGDEMLLKAMKIAGNSIPGPWNWRNRDAILAAHAVTFSQHVPEGADPQRIQQGTYGRRSAAGNTS